MPSFYETKILLNKASQIYALVMDIEKYPEFLPWCKHARIVDRSSDQNLQADLLINFKNFFERYRSDVNHGKSSENSYFIDVMAIEGPFKNLVNRWQIEGISEQSCEVKFFIEFEFRSSLLNKMIGTIFTKAAEKMITAFEARAKATFS